MSNVDWSKAPEGATHWEPESDDWYSSWMMLNGDGWHWRPSSSEGWMKCREVNESRVCAMIPRLPAWNGEGLPPVGAVVEWFIPVYGWLGGRVVGHDGTVAVISHNDGYTGCHPHEVRPVRTPEQLAAEARENDLNRMVATAQMLDKGWARKVCEALYDAGYRKQEQPE